MTQTLAQVRTNVRERLNETTARAWTNAEITRWINEGLRDVARTTECLLTSSTIAVVAGTQTYTGPTDVIRIHRVQYEPTGSTQKYPLEAREINTLDSVWWTSQSITQSTPIYYYTWGFAPAITIGLYPIPALAGNLRVFYARFPTDLIDVTNDAVAVDCPEGWHDLVVDYAEYRALRRARDPRWQECYSRYHDAASALLATVAGSGPTWTDAPGRIVPQNPVGYPAWLYNDTGSW